MLPGPRPLLFPAYNPICVSVMGCTASALLHFAAKAKGGTGLERRIVLKSRNWAAAALQTNLKKTTSLSGRKETMSSVSSGWSRGKTRRASTRSSAGPRGLLARQNHFLKLVARRAFKSLHATTDNEAKPANPARKRKVLCFITQGIMWIVTYYVPGLLQGASRQESLSRSTLHHPLHPRASIPVLLPHKRRYCKWR